MPPSNLKLPVNAAELVPHRESMLLIQTLDTFAEDTANGRLVVSEENLFIRKNGQLDPIVCVELLAQLVAAHSGYKAKLKHDLPKIGFLVGIKDFTILGKIQIGDDLVLTIKKDYAFDQITYLTGIISRSSEQLAKGTLKLWEQSGNSLLPREEAEQEVLESSKKIFNPGWRNIASKMVLNDQILKCLFNMKLEGSDSSVQMVFDKSFPGFHGHFPDMPILPGVMMLKTGTLIGELMTGYSLSLVRIKQAKFAKNVFPDELIDIKTTLQYQDNRIRLNTVIVKKNETCAKFSIDCQKQ